MEPIQTIIAENLKRLRKEKKLSLEALAKRSGVSKSMLSQIESGEVNPTIGVVWKITNGLKISFTELMSRPEQAFEVVSIDDIQPLYGEDARYRTYMIFPFQEERRFELYYIELDANSRLDASAHPDGSQEFFTVVSGVLDFTMLSHHITLPTGTSLRFQADQPHIYENRHSEPCRLTMMIYYPKSSK